MDVNFETDISKQIIYLGDESFTAADAIAGPDGTSHLEQLMISRHGVSSFEHDLAVFLRQWFDSSDVIKVKTSGSTGVPKVIMVEKERMMNSARLTLSFLGLNNGDSALLCMPLGYIAGKMMVVRALTGGLKLLLVPPCSNPAAELHDDTHVSFAAMIPMQVINGLADPDSARRLKAVEHLIIGGGAVESDLAAQLASFEGAVWSTYGMTETLSHIALRRLSGPEASSWYTPFDQVTLTAGEDNTLIVNAPLVNSSVLETNDIVEFNDAGQFRILGRRDNVINSGGVKLQIEEIEQWLNSRIRELSSEHPRLRGCQSMVSSRPDHQFGYIAVMLYQLPDTEADLNEEELERLFTDIPKYWKPRALVRVPKLPLTGTGKPDRVAARSMAARDDQ